MKTESFDKLLKTRFSKEKIAELHKHAELEAAYIDQMKKIITDSLEEYIKKNNAKPDDIAKQLGWSTSKISKLKNGEYNLGLSDFGRLLATLKKDPIEIFKMNK